MAHRDVDAIERGREALSRGQWAEARSHFAAALEEEESPEAYEGLGVAARYQLDAEAALEAHERGYTLMLSSTGRAHEEGERGSLTDPLEQAEFRALLCATREHKVVPARDSCLQSRQADTHVCRQFVEAL
jgi:hypothetical protein